MEQPATRFLYVRTEEKDGRTVVTHDIDQFWWFRQAMEHTLTPSEKKKGERLLSAVRFYLPFAPGREVPRSLIVVGNGLSVCDVYLACSQHLLNPPQKPRLWKLFDYYDSKKHNVEPKMRQPPCFPQIFATHLFPFLKGLDYPLDCLRVYNFHCSYNADRVRVVADNRENRELQTLEIKFVPDNRNGPPQSVITLRRVEGAGWTSPDLEQKLSTEKFALTH